MLSFIMINPNLSSGESPLTLRAKCLSNRYFPDPLGSLLHIKTMDHERIFVTGRNQDA